MIWAFGLLYRRFSFQQAIVGGLVIIVSAVLVAVPWVWHIFHAFPAESENIYAIIKNANRTVIEGHTGQWYFYLNKFRIMFGEVIYLPMAATLCYFVRKSQNFQMGFVLTWIGLPLLVLSSAATKRDTYLLILAPAVFILTGYWTRVLLLRYRNIWGHLAVALLLLLPLRYGIERSKLFQERLRVPDWMAEIKTIKQNLSPAPDRTVVLGFEHNLELMFHTGVIAYPFEPETGLVEKLKREGYTVLHHTKKGLVPY